MRESLSPLASPGYQLPRHDVRGRSHGRDRKWFRQLAQFSGHLVFLAPYSPCLVVASDPRNYTSARLRERAASLRNGNPSHVPEGWAEATVSDPRVWEKHLDRKLNVNEICPPPHSQ